MTVDFIGEQAVKSDSYKLLPSEIMFQKLLYFECIDKINNSEHSKSLFDRSVAVRRPPTVQFSVRYYYKMFYYYWQRIIYRRTKWFISWQRAYKILD